MTLFILCDLEGAAGVVDFQSQTYATGVYTFRTEYISADSAESRASRDKARRIDTRTVEITADSLVDIARNR